MTVTADPVRAAAELVASRCLRRGASLFSPRDRVWTAERLDDLAGRLGPDERTLLEEVLLFPQVAELERAAPIDQELPPTLVLRFRKDDVSLALFSMIATMGTPFDVSLQHARLELFFPADEETSAWFAQA
jgi:hypothetical protein